tara:strand:- start:11798 stop:12301 length:504 start_codon:yes stop_codon:yes gene_type:complete
MKKYQVTNSKKVEHKEGDQWTEKGKLWTIKNGIKKTITKTEQLRKQVMMPLGCPECAKSMKSHWDAKFWKTHRTCFDCVIEMEHEVRKQGKWDEYEKAKMSANAKSFLQEVRAGLEEYKETSATNTHVTEKGKIEKWENPDNKVIAKMIDNEIEKLEAVVKAVGEKK